MIKLLFDGKPDYATVVNCKKGDSGRKLSFKVEDFDVSSCDKILLSVLKSSKKLWSFPVQATSSNSINIFLSPSILSVAGLALLEFSFLKGSDKITSSPVVLNVIESNGEIDDKNESYLLNDMEEILSSVFGKVEGNVPILNSDSYDNLYTDLEEVVSNLNVTNLSEAEKKIFEHESGNGLNLFIQQTEPTERWGIWIKDNPKEKCSIKTKDYVVAGENIADPAFLPDVGFLTAGEKFYCFNGSDYLYSEGEENIDEARNLLYNHGYKVNTNSYAFVNSKYVLSDLNITTTQKAEFKLRTSNYSDTQKFSFPIDSSVIAEKFDKIIFTSNYLIGCSDGSILVLELLIENLPEITLKSCYCCQIPALGSKITKIAVNADTPTKIAFLRGSVLTAFDIKNKTTEDFSLRSGVVQEGSPFVISEDWILYLRYDGYLVHYDIVTQNSTFLSFEETPLGIGYFHGNVYIMHENNVERIALDQLIIPSDKMYIYLTEGDTYRAKIVHSSVNITGNLEYIAFNDISYQTSEGAGTGEIYLGEGSGWTKFK